ncbi:CGNR zinc finger domain-containing protein [Streptomyces sp. NPDC004783]
MCGAVPRHHRAANRRWCSMNTCGNKVKKSRIKAS